MRVTAILLVLAASCEPDRPVATTPARQLLAEARGTVTDARGGPVEGASVVVRVSQKPVCAAVVTEARTTTDRLGAYSTLLSLKTAQDTAACVTVTATGAGTVGSGSGQVVFRSTSPSNSPDVSSVDVRLQRAEPLSREGADALAAGIVAAINGDAERAANLHSLIYGGKASVDAGLRNLRHYLGRAESAQYKNTEGSNRDVRYSYRVVGTSGRSSELVISQDETVRVWNPLLYYSGRADRMTSEMIRLIAANDATTLARLLTADDIDFPVPDAQKIIDDYRRRYGSRSLSASFDRLEETRNSIIYRIDGTNDEIEMGYGDGLLFLK
jgi:hypothetical protein